MPCTYCATRARYATPVPMCNRHYHRVHLYGNPGKIDDDSARPQIVRVGTKLGTLQIEILKHLCSTHELLSAQALADLIGVPRYNVSEAIMFLRRRFGHDVIKTRHVGGSLRLRGGYRINPALRDEITQVFSSSPKG